jgi:hypothetical protein
VEVTMRFQKVGKFYRWHCDCGARQISPSGYEISKGKYKIHLEEVHKEKSPRVKSPPCPDCDGPRYSVGTIITYGGRRYERLGSYCERCDKIWRS